MVSTRRWWATWATQSWAAGVIASLCAPKKTACSCRCCPRRCKKKGGVYFLAFCFCWRGRREKSRQVVARCHLYVARAVLLFYGACCYLPAAAAACRRNSIHCCGRAAATAARRCGRAAAAASRCLRAAAPHRGHVRVRAVAKHAPRPPRGAAGADARDAGLWSDPFYRPDGGRFVRPVAPRFAVRSTTRAPKISLSFNHLQAQRCELPRDGVVQQRRGGSGGDGGRASRSIRAAKDEQGGAAG